MIFVLLITITYSACSQRCFVVISKEIEKKCTGGKGKWNGTSFNELRTKLYNEGRLNFINSNLDTLYLLESYEIESGTYVSRIWNKNGFLNYTYTKGNFSFDQQQLFTNFTVQLVQKWDTATIKKEESVNAISLPEKYINATRVFMVKKKTKINCIKFKEFFKLERDR